MTDGPLVFAASAALGALVGLGELLSRYRDKASRMLLSAPALLYMGVNAAASMIALALFETFNISFGLPEANDGPRMVLRVLASGLGAMAFFRSAFFVVRVGDQDVAVGAGSFLQLVLSATDRAVDRLQGAGRSSIARQLTRGVSFAKAYEVLPISCLNLVQGVPDAEQAALGDDIQKLFGNTALSDSARAYNLGLLLIHVVGEDVLRAAIEALGDSIRSAPPDDASQLGALRPGARPHPSEG